MTKKCSACGSIKGADEFNRKLDGLQPDCRSCSNAKSRAYHHGPNKKSHLANIKRNKAARVGLNQQKLWEYLLGHPCVDCGNCDPRVLEFDHLRDKTNDVTRILAFGVSWKSVLEEIEKCEVRCCNCHRIKTFERAGSWRAKRGPHAEVEEAPDF